MPRRSVTTTPRRRETARTKLSEIATASRKADDDAKRKRHRMYAGMLKGFNAGLTYKDLVEITGLSQIRVSQILAEQRENGQ